MQKEAGKTRGHRIFPRKRSRTRGARTGKTERWDLMGGKNLGTGKRKDLDCEPRNKGNLTKKRKAKATRTRPKGGEAVMGEADLKIRIPEGKCSRRI